MKLNKYELSVIGFFLFVIFGVGFFTHPFSPKQAEQKLDNKIKCAEAYYEEAKALSLSMPILNDSTVGLIIDSLMITLIDLNRSWVIFVKTQDDFEKYTNRIENLNGNLEQIRIKYEIERGMRILIREFQKLTPITEKKEKGRQV